ncbi:MAG: type II CRISPR RNA-guided endonuclease Cas9 [Brumimicrobium sp.]|nr:type II CRISPR RNA-guided endonuclease Cas9 [Brumimicrobium sp.]
MKKILGLDLGTTSIGWAYVHEAENDTEVSSIIKTGVRVVPLSTDEENDFKKGKSITINADRTLKRGMRRNKYRFKMRRADLINELKNIDFISDETVLTETDSTHDTIRLRAEAVHKKIEKDQFARLLLMINKKRGYKSSRKANNSEEGELIDSMGVSKRLRKENITPGELNFKLLVDGKKVLPTYYRSDLKCEFDRIWNKQKDFYPEILNDDLYKELEGKNKGATWKVCEKPFNIVGIKRKNKGKEQAIENYEWRKKALREKIDLEELAVVLQEINNQINQSSGYLSEISDRSKVLYFNDITVGEYQYELIKSDPNNSLKNQVFYRQDYITEFDKIWDKQAEFYKELTPELKKKIGDQIIFYQRKLKSQKGLISYCEFESWEQDVIIDGEKKRKTIGQRVIPKSSPLFQNFRIWQNINAIVIANIKDNTEYLLDEETKYLLFKKLNWVYDLSEKDLLKWLGLSDKQFKVNFEKIQGNRTNEKLLESYEKLFLFEGNDNISFSKMEAEEIEKVLKDGFTSFGIDAAILDFNPHIEGDEFDKQASYKLWHLLYSYEEDDSRTGNDKLIEKLQKTFGFKKEHAEIIANVSFEEDYGNLSSRAIKKILPFLEEGETYDKACALAGYNHSSSLTREQNDERKLQNRIEILKKNSLRNPVVEKILNQMINVVNAILEDKEMGRPDEIRIELARELKKNAKQRAEMTSQIGKATREHEDYRQIIRKEFGLKYVSKNDLIRYKLFKELESNGGRTIYSNTKIRPDELFTNKYDIEHIIPKSRIFDDSYSNKTLELRDINLKKGELTALDYMQTYFNEKDVEAFKQRVEHLHSSGAINGAKKRKLLMTEKNIPEDFLARDLGNSAYIARKSGEILIDVVRKVSFTSGSITDRLRSDWGLINVLKDLNWDKYDKIGMTYYQENNKGEKLRRIKDWSKRNDHRHHAMDAIAVAFCKPVYVQYLNNLHARGENKKGNEIYGIESKYTFKDDRGKRKFIPPFEGIRRSAKEHLSGILISHKTKNKVTTTNRNKIKVQGGYKYQKVETPRGQLHKETVYGSSYEYMTKYEKIGSKFDKEKVLMVANKKFREALLNRLEEFGNDPKKAFAGNNTLAKNPVYLSSSEQSVPEKVKLVWKEKRYTIRKEITPDLKLDKVIDKGIKKILLERLAEFNNKPKEAFVDLEKNPIWLNKEKGIAVKRVSISGVSNAEALHDKQNHFGENITENGKTLPNDFVSTGNNHHVAVYRDKKGDLQEEVVSFFEAVVRKNAGQPIIKKQHENGWEFLFTMKQNEMFVFPNEETGFDPKEIDLMDEKNYPLISPNLFRVQKFSKLIYGNSAVRDYVFRHHLETQLNDAKELKDIIWYNLKSLSVLNEVVKVRLNHLGKIVGVGEY